MTYVERNGQHLVVYAGRIVQAFPSAEAALQFLKPRAIPSAQ